MKILKYVSLVLLIFYLQVNFFGAFQPFGVIPNIFLIFIVYLGLARPSGETLILAIAGGSLFDIVSGSDFGLRMAFFAVTALVIMVMGQAGADIENVGTACIVIFLATILYNAAILTNISAYLSLSHVGHFASKILIEALMNLALFLMLRPLFKLIIKKPQQNLPAIGFQGGR